MEPVHETTHGYRVKVEYENLMPVTQGRPSNYYYTAYCLPEYNQIFQLAMEDLENMDGEVKYYGAFNNSFQ